MGRKEMKHGMVAGGGASRRRVEHMHLPSWPCDATGLERDSRRARSSMGYDTLRAGASPAPPSASHARISTCLHIPRLSSPPI